MTSSSEPLGARCCNFVSVSTMVPRRQPFESDALKFPLWRAITAPRKEACKGRLASGHVDAFRVEIKGVQKRCSVPELRSVSTEEHEVNDVIAREAQRLELPSCQPASLPSSKQVMDEEVRVLPKESD